MPTTTNHRNIVASTSIVYVNTAIDSNAIVLISTPTYFGETLTITDTAGSTSGTYPITVSTTSSISFFNGISSFLIQQPLGSFTVSAAASNLWQLQNTFGYKQGQLPTAATIQQLQVSTINFIDSAVVGVTDLLQFSDEILYIGSNSVIAGNNNFKNVTTGLINASTMFLYDTYTPPLSSNASYVATGTYSNSNSIVTYSYDGVTWNNTSNNLPPDYPTYIGFGGTYNPNDLSGNYYSEVVLGTDGYATDLYIYGSSNGINFNTVTKINNTTLEIGPTSNSIVKYLYSQDNLASNYAVLLSPLESVPYLYLGDLQNGFYNTNQLASAPTQAIYNIDYGHGYYLLAGDYNILFTYLLNAIQFTQYNNFNTDYGSFQITGIKYSAVDSLFIILGYDPSSGSNYPYIFTNASIDSSNWSISGTVITDDSLNSPYFWNQDIYINQGTYSSLPRIVYAGSNTSGSNQLVYYSYIQNLSNQGQFCNYNFSNQPFTQINSIIETSNALLFTTNSPYVIIATADQLSNNTYSIENTRLLTVNGATYAPPQQQQTAPLDSNIRLNISGTLHANVLTIQDQLQANIQIPITASNNVLYREPYPINPVGGQIEFNFNNLTTIQYPLCIGSLSNFTQGWWSPSLTPGNVSGFVTDPGYALTVWSSNNYIGDIIVYTSNTGCVPVYSNIVTGIPAIEYIIGGFLPAGIAQQYTYYGSTYSNINIDNNNIITNTFSVVYSQSNYITSGYRFNGIDGYHFYINASIGGINWCNIRSEIYPSGNQQYYNTIADQQNNRFIVLNYNDIGDGPLQYIESVGFDGSFSNYSVSYQLAANSIVYGSNTYIIYKTNNNGTEGADNSLLVTSNIDSQIFSYASLPEVCNNIQFSGYHGKFFAAAGSNIYTSSNGSDWLGPITSNINPLSPFITLTNIGEFYINQHTPAEIGLPTFIFPDFGSSNLYYTYDTDITNISNMSNLWVQADYIYGVKRFQSQILAYGTTYTGGEVIIELTSFITSLNKTDFFNSNYTTTYNTGLNSIISLAVNTDYALASIPPASYTLQAIP